MLQGAIHYLTLLFWTSYVWQAACQLGSNTHDQGPTSMYHLQANGRKSTAAEIPIDGAQDQQVLQSQQDLPVLNRSLIDAHLDDLYHLQRQREAVVTARNKIQSPLVATDTYFAVCTVVRDDPDLLLEWIMYHHQVMQIQRFYVFDNNSTSSVLQVLLPLIKAGIVVYDYFAYVSWRQSVMGSVQIWAYNECMTRWREHHDWIAFWDVDEFLVLKDTQLGPLPPGVPRQDRFSLLPSPKGPLEEFLFQFEGAGGLSINWMIFNSDGHCQPPPGVLGYFTKCVDSTTVKTIASTYFFKWLGPDPHNYNYTHGAVAVSEDGERVAEHSSRVAKTRHVVLYHYLLRSTQDMLAKLRKKGAWARYNRPVAAFDEWEKQVEDNHWNFECSLLNQYKNSFILRNNTEWLSLADAVNPKTPSY